MKRDPRFPTLSDAFEHYQELAPNVRPIGETLEEKVTFYETTGEAELIRLNAQAPAATPRREAAPVKVIPFSRPESLRRFGTIEMAVSHYRTLAPKDLVSPPAEFTTLDEQLEWYMSVGEDELERLAERAVDSLRTEIAGMQSGIVELDRKVSASTSEITGRQLQIRSAKAEIAGINALPSIIEFNRLTAAVASCDQRMALVSANEQLLSGFAATKGFAS